MNTILKLHISYIL